MATVTTRDVMRAGGLIRRIEEYREATGRQAWIKSTRVMLVDLKRQAADRG